MSKSITPNRMPLIYGQFQHEPKFRHAALCLAKALQGFTEQQQNDCLRMAKRIIEWNHAEQNINSPYNSELFKSSIDERDIIMRGII